MCDQWKSNVVNRNETLISAKMCDQWKKIDSTKILSTKEWFSVLDAAKKLKTRIVSVTGGEALLRNDIFEILEGITKRGMTAHLCTNGTTLTQDNILNLAKSRLRSISVSLDSHAPENHNFLRGYDCFHDTVEGIQLLRKMIPDLKININFLLCRINYKQMCQMIDLGKQLGVNKISLAPIHQNLQHKDKPKNSFHDLFFYQSDIPDLNRQILKVMRYAKKKQMPISSVRFLKGITNFYTVAPPYHNCYAGFICCAISPWGDVSPCVDMASSVNIRNKPLDQIWTSNTFHLLRGKAQSCSRRCWDTTNAELSIRCQLSGFLHEINNNVKDIMRYK
jgi:MoaA/NifB/PqqE/SkfB family radical SAM enzyme